MVAAFLLRALTSRGPWLPDWRLWLVTFVALFAAAWFVTRAQKLRAAHTPKVGIRDLESENWPVLVALGLIMVAEAAAIGSFDFVAGAGLIGLVLAWTVLSSLPWLRHFEFRSSIQATCRPEAAFALVSNPQNWRLWTPEIEHVELSEVPLRPGTIVRSRMRADGRLVDVEERVIVFDPPRRCGSELVGVPGASDQYEIVANEDGALITYKLRFMESLWLAPLGGAIIRRRAVKRSRKVSMRRIKQLLEEGAASSV